jgi:HrpA-like RNA helicase
MSATIDSQMFANYFSVPVGDTLSPSPILTVQGRTYKVSQFFLDHLTELADVSM